MKKLYPLQERYALEVLQSKFFLCMNSSFALAVHTRHLHQLSNIPLIYFYKQHLKRHNTVTVLCLKWNTVISQTKNVEKKLLKRGTGFEEVLLGLVFKPQDTELYQMKLEALMILEDTTKIR